jgi:hypothetical protein
MTITRFLFTLLTFVIAIATVTAYNQTIYSNNTTYIVPAGTTSIYVQVWGGGGSGGTAGSTSTSGGGGGGGFASSIFTVTPGTNFTVKVGAGGAEPLGGTSSGNSGYNSLFYNSSVTINASGGGGGVYSAGGVGAGGTPGAGVSGNFLLISGGTGGSSVFATGGGAGGGGAGTLSNGSAGSVGATGSGAGGINLGGAGGIGGLKAGGLSTEGLLYGGGGGGRAGAYSGNTYGGNGSVIVNAFNSSDNLTMAYYVSISIKNAANNSLVSGNTTVLLQNTATLGTYNYTTSSGNVIRTKNTFSPGTYIVSVSNPAFTNPNSIYLTIDDSSSNSISTIYLDNSTQATVFSVTDTLGNIVNNATFSFSRNIGGSVVVYAQKTSDVTSFITLNLNPNYIYSITGTEPSGTYNNYTGLIQPNQAVTYSLKMTFSSGGITYPSPYNNTYLSKDATYNNVTKKINVTWEVISSLGTIDYFGLNTTYNGSVYSQNVSGSPGGGIAYVNISNVNLSMNNSINVSFYFQRNGFPVEYITVPFTFLDVATGNNSLTGGLFTPPTAPSSTTGRAILGMILLIIIVAGTYKFTNDGAVTALVACIIVGVFSITSVALFPKLYGLISVVVGLMVVFGGMINKRI